MKTLSKKSILGVLLLTLGSPVVANAEPLLAPLSDKWLLISILGGGVLMLFACILALTYLLYKSVPILVEKQIQKDKSSEVTTA